MQREARFVSALSTRAGWSASMFSGSVSVSAVGMKAPSTRQSVAMPAKTQRR